MNLQVLPFVGTLRPPLARMRSCLCACDHQAVSYLSDDGTVSLLRGNFDSNKEVAVETEIDIAGNVLAQAWDDKGEVLAVAGTSLTVLVAKERLPTVTLYFTANDVTVCRHKGVLMIAVAGSDGVQVYTVTQSCKECQLLCHLHEEMNIALVRFSPDANHLAVAGLDGSFVIHKVPPIGQDWKDVWSIYQRRQQVLHYTSLAFSPNSELVALLSWDATCIVLRKVGNFSWQPVHQLNRSVSSVRVSASVPIPLLSWSPDAAYFSVFHSTSHGQEIALHSISTMDCHKIRIPSSFGTVKGVAPIHIGSQCGILAFGRSRQVLFMACNELK